MPSPARSLLAAAAMLLVPGIPRAEEPPTTPRTEDPAEGGIELAARALMSEALYLESGMGDYREAAARYREVLAGEAKLPDAVLAEALLRLGDAHQALMENTEAEQAYRQILKRFPSSAWSSAARLRLQSLDEEAKEVRSLPFSWSFDKDVGGVFHHRRRAHKGHIDHEILAEGDRDEGVVAWHSFVIGGEDDLLMVGLDKNGLTVQGDLSVRILAGRFPVHLIFFLVDLEGQLYGTAPVRVHPDDGWTRFEWHAADFSNRAISGAESRYRPRPIRHLMIQDVTGHQSTDRGDHVVYIDDLNLR